MPNKEKKAEQKIYKKWWFWVIIVVVIIAIAAGAGSNKNGGNGSNNSGNDVSYEDNTTPKSSNEANLGETFSFDDLEITIGTTITFETLKNEFSDHNGETVVKIPITTKNTKNETHSLNMYSYKIFGSKGTEIDTASAYYMDDSIDFGGDLRPGATITKNLYFYYDGDGEYVIEFGYYSTDKTVKINIKK